MKIPHFKKIVTAFLMAVIAGVVTFGVTGASGEAPDHTPQDGDGVAPTFTGLNITGAIENSEASAVFINTSIHAKNSLGIFNSSDVKDSLFISPSQIHNDSETSDLLRIASSTILQLFGQDSVAISSDTSITLNTPTLTFKGFSNDSVPVTVGASSNPTSTFTVWGDVKAKSFGQIYYKDSGWITHEEGDEKITSLACDDADVVIGCWLNDKDTHMLRLDVRNQFFLDSKTCQVNFNALAPVEINQSIVCLDPDGSHTGSLYPNSDGSGSATLPEDDWVWSGFVDPLDLSYLSLLSSNAPQNLDAQYWDFGPNDGKSYLLSWDPPAYDSTIDDIIGYKVQVEDEDGYLIFENCPSAEDGCFMVEEVGVEAVGLGELVMQIVTTTYNDLNTWDKDFVFKVTAIYGTENPLIQTGKSLTANLQYHTFECSPSNSERHPEIIAESFINDSRILYWNNDQDRICYPNKIVGFEFKYLDDNYDILHEESVEFIPSEYALGLVNDWGDMILKEEWNNPATFFLGSTTGAAYYFSEKADYLLPTFVSMRIQYADGSFGSWSSAYELY